MTKNFHSKGFSMAELMIVLAIIGILAAIAGPLYIHQVNQSHQNEAKGNLTSLDAAMKSFWAEYASNTGYLDLIGWKPTGTLSYNYGFLGALPALPSNVLGAHGTGCYMTTLVAGPCLGTWAAPTGFTNLTSATSAAAFTGAASFPGGGAWTAYARANLRNGQNDQWTIDSHDTLINTLNGI